MNYIKYLLLAQLIVLALLDKMYPVIQIIIVLAIVGIDITERKKRITS